MEKQWKQWEILFGGGGSKITVDVDCTHEIKRCLLLGRKVMTNLDSILKSRDITLSTKVHVVKTMVFSSGHVCMWELDYWVLKNWSFWTVVSEKTLESPWTSRRSKQSILKEVSPEYSLEGCWSWNSNTLAIWCEELTPWKRPWWWERLKAEGEGVARVEMVGWHHWLNGNEFG